MSGAFNQRWSLVGDYQLRYYSPFNDLQQVLLRTFGQYSFNEHLSLGIGYAYVLNGSPGKQDVPLVVENRPSQQLTFRWNKARWRTQLRARIEERLIGSASPSFRARIFTGALWRFTKVSDWAVAGTEELFWYPDGMRFDQNRSFIGLSYRFNDHFRLESGALVILKKSEVRQELFTQLVHTFNW
jgi:hypothetical protein